MGVEGVENKTKKSGGRNKAKGEGGGVPGQGYFCLFLPKVEINELGAASLLTAQPFFF